MSIHLNIHNRLALVLWGIAMLAFVLVGAGLVFYQSLTLEQRAEQLMQPYVELVAVGTDAAVAFEDPQRAQEILDTLRANPQIMGAEIYLQSGEVLAGFSQIPNAKPRPMSARPDGIYLERDSVELMQELPRGAHLRITMGLEQLGEQSRQVIWIFAIGVLVLLAVTLAQMAVLQRMIVSPIALLTEATEVVQARSDYKYRVPAIGNDEVARLGQNFNAMMGAIQGREDDLQRLSLFQRTILDNLAYSIISTTQDGIVTSFNPAAEHLLGYAADEVIGKQTPALWHDAEEVARRAKQLTQELGETITPGFDVFTARPQRNLTEENEWTFIRKDGTYVSVNLSVTALRDESRRISGFVGIIYDLTERKQAEEEIHRLNAELEQRVVERTVQLEAANMELEEFSYSVSHDLRIPLRAIDGFSHLLIEGYGDKLDDEGKRMLKVVRHNTSRMGLLIDGILEFLHIYRAAMKLSVIDMQDLALSVMQELQPDKGKLQVEIEQLPPCLGDQTMLRRIWMNLLSNALKFSQLRENPMIKIGGYIEGDKAVYFVQDNGVGFDMQYANKLFGVFHRLHGVSEFEGSGIGLAIVKRIINRHGGRVWAEGKLDAGATFYFSLPQSSNNITTG